MQRNPGVTATGCFLPSVRACVRRCSWLAALLGAGLGGCGATPYTPGTYVDAGGGRTYAYARTLGDCLDLAARTVVASDVGPRIIVEIVFGNRCDRGLPIDLRALRVVATCGGQGGLELSPYDPRGEMGPGRLAPHGEGWERIAFGAAPCPAVPTGVCADFSGITPSAATRGAVGLRDRPERAAMQNGATTICFPEPQPQTGGAP
jgi:hypothetical protein